MAHVVYVDGQDGTTGLQIREVLAGRTDIEVLTIAPERRKDASERRRLLNEAQVAFLCLPDDAAREAVAMVENPSTCIIDASTAHRTAPGWVFGLPELAPDQRARLRASTRIANPGCHATAFILLVRPLVSAGLVAPTMLLSATSLTGYSGGGRRRIEQYEAADRAPRLQAPRPYALGLAHKHLPEMVAHTGLVVPPVFMPVIGPYYKGLGVTIPLHLSQLPVGTTPAAVSEILRRYYADEHFVSVLPPGDAASLDDGHFDVTGANDTNRVDLCVFASDSQLLLAARLDNLGKGASGAAVQCMNIHLGLDERLGLVG